ncbi:hypothetical protein GCM10023339_46580 [Alloalcanivorax gelatiniphagus]
MSTALTILVFLSIWSVVTGAVVVVSLLRRAARAASPAAAATSGHVPVRLETVGACIASVNTVPSTAAERGVVIVDLKFELTSGAGAGVHRSTWEVDISAIAQLEPGRVIAVGWDAESRAIWPIEDWARRRSA